MCFLNIEQWPHFKAVFNIFGPIFKMAHTKFNCQIKNAAVKRQARIFVSNVIERTMRAHTNTRLLANAHTQTDRRTNTQTRHQQQNAKERENWLT